MAQAVFPPDAALRFKAGKLLAGYRYQQLRHIQRRGSSLCFRQKRLGQYLHAIKLFIPGFLQRTDSGLRCGR